MPNDTISNPMLVTYSGFVCDFGVLPQTSLTAMVRRGVSHFFGSEMASKVTAFFAVDDEGNSPAKTAGIEDNAESRAAKKAEFQKAAYEALLAGTVGVSTRGPTVEPVVKIERRLAKAEVTGILTEHKVAIPKKAEDTITTPDGGKFTMAQLVDRRLAHAEHGPRIRREAAKELADKLKKAAKAAEAAKGEGLSGL